jgi:NADH-quinone oxidoreductase subunit G
MSANPQQPAAAADLVTIEVDGRTLQARKGQMLIEVTDAAGIYIPRFCYHEELSIAANCRMCLVEVEKAPKPLPACATPVMDGMKVWTHSGKARDAQKGTMEFLLINHPLDCPVCDQGGECMLQDLALGYGKDASRYQEMKRVVADKDIGPLIATDMTRCIHCTRCVRFGREIAGVMEFGGIGRGEHMEIRTFLDRSVDSELSGNVIDLCPVGALTSKPFRYTARPWELESHPSVSPHDCVGANIEVQTRRGQILRVLPRENKAVNGPWLADRDRFSYEALNGEDRLTRPMIRRGHQWEETDWNTALDFVAAGLKRAIDRHGAAQLGALAAPTSTIEEFYLLQKLVRALGSGNVDHRLRQSDFRDDEAAPLYPSLGMNIADLERLGAVLLIGANPRKDQPLLNLRLRKAALKGARVFAINPLDYDFNYRLAGKVVCDPAAMVGATARVAVALASIHNGTVSSEVKALAGAAPGETEKATAESLAKGNSAVLLGAYALNHPQAAVLRSLAALIGELSGAKAGQLPPANGAGAWLAGCVPHRGAAGAAATVTGRNARAMLSDPLKTWLLFGLEPELDCGDGALAARALGQAEFVAMFTAFKPSARVSHAADYAHAWLPLAPFTETDGTFVNAEARHQSFEAALAPAGEARPGWKILRVLANRLGLDGFSHNTIADVRAEIRIGNPAQRELRPAVFELAASSTANGQLQRIAEVPIYAVDALTRRAVSLQHTADNPPPALRLNPADAARLGFETGDTARVSAPGGETRLEVVRDGRVPAGCALIAAGHAETAALGGHGPVTVGRA